MKIKNIFKSLFKHVDEPTEPTYVFEFTMMQIAFIKAALRLSGLEYQNNRKIYKMLCEAGCDEEEKQLLARYE